MNLETKITERNATMQPVGSKEFSINKAALITFRAALFLTAFSFGSPITANIGCGVKRCAWDISDGATYFYKANHYNVQDIIVESKELKIIYRQNLQKFFYTISPFDEKINNIDEITFGLEYRLPLSDQDNLLVNYYPQEIVDEIYFYRDSGNQVGNKKIHKQKLRLGFEKKEVGFYLKIGVSYIKEVFEIYQNYFKGNGTTTFQSNYNLNTSNWSLEYTGASYLYNLDLDLGNLATRFYLISYPKNIAYLVNAQYKFFENDNSRMSGFAKINFDKNKKGSVYASYLDGYEYGLKTEFFVDNFLLGLTYSYFMADDWFCIDSTPITYQFQTLDGFMFSLDLKYQDLFKVNYKPVSEEIYFSTSFEL